VENRSGKNSIKRKGKGLRGAAKQKRRNFIA